MNKYVLITASHMGDCTATCITAKDEFGALAKAYNYYSGYTLTSEEFEILCNNVPANRLYRLFKEFTGESILYLALKPDRCIICDLLEVE